MERGTAHGPVNERADEISYRGGGGGRVVALSWAACSSGADNKEDGPPELCRSYLWT